MSHQPGSSSSLCFATCESPLMAWQTRRALSRAALSWPYVSYATATLARRPPISSSKGLVERGGSGVAERLRVAHAVAASNMFSLTAVGAFKFTRSGGSIEPARPLRIVTITFAKRRAPARCRFDVFHIFQTNRKTDVVRRHAGFFLLGRGQLLVRGRGWMDHQALGVADVGEVRQQLHRVDKLLARFQPALMPKPTMRRNRSSDTSRQSRVGSPGNPDM